ncbi:MAG: tRNA (adenosine(37)-N6)-threonylcarbamoyltransferase complex ATPase subunit type 1 TsaE [Lachnospiraceae bacterium]|nr:tRNA (adenosine(37)-N6)-threonylcarbamoyltransferase complex ATPase subunit type 1 TsaE [Lachnospiraceae bacterium]
MKEIYESFSEEDTFGIAKKMAESAVPGGVYALTGGLGAGKTAFAKGFAAGLGITEPVVSPTFTIVQIYESGRMPLYHFDVYRLGDISEMDEIGYEDCFYGEGVSLVEWADLVEPVLPDGTYMVSFEKDIEKGTDYRKITIESSKDEDNSH